VHLAHMTVKLLQGATARLHKTFKMQTMIVKEHRSVLLLHYVSISFHTLENVCDNKDIV